MECYRLYLPLFFKAMVGIILVLFTGIGGCLIWVALTYPGMNLSPLLGVLWLMAMLLPWLWVVSIPSLIQVGEDGKVELKSLIRTRRINAADIIAIQPDPAQLGFLIIKLRKGKIRLLNQYDGFHMFLTDLKQRNPSLILRGC